MDRYDAWLEGACAGSGGRVWNDNARQTLVEPFEDELSKREFRNLPTKLLPSPDRRPIRGACVRIGHRVGQWLSLVFLREAPLDTAPSTPPQGAPRRQDFATTAQVKAARDRLVHGPGIRPEFEYELLTTFARNELEATFTIPLLAIVCALASSFWAPPMQAFVWLIFVLLAKFYLLHACRQLLNLPRNEVNVQAWRRRLVRTELMYGIAWAGIAVLGLGTRDTTAPVFIFSALVVVPA